MVFSKLTVIDLLSVQAENRALTSFSPRAPIINYNVLLTILLVCLVMRGPDYESSSTIYNPRQGGHSRLQAYVGLSGQFMIVVSSTGTGTPAI
jgi:hypothetical protein